jgi:hypothetical protein
MLARSAKLGVQMAANVAVTTMVVRMVKLANCGPKPSTRSPWMLYPRRSSSPRAMGATVNENLQNEMAITQNMQRSPTKFRGIFTVIWSLVASPYVRYPQSPTELYKMPHTKITLTDVFNKTDRKRRKRENAE